VTKAERRRCLRIISKMHDEIAQQSAGQGNVFSFAMPGL
jgi:hypothetical protein